jgi:hypothetical protein
VATHVTATTPRTSPAPRLGVLAVAIVAAIAVAVIGLGVWSQVGSARDAAAVSRVYGAGYPLHGGLAGPSRSMQAIDPSDHYGPGYPLHGGLAGPSRIESGD